MKTMIEPGSEEIEYPFDGKFVGRVHERAVRVYFEDTDFSGVVYHASYVRFLERGRSDYLRATGLNHAELARKKMAFAVARMEIDFKRPAGIDDVLVVSTQIETATPARLIFRQDLKRDGVLLVDARATIAMLGEDKRPKRIPPELLAQALNSLTFTA